MTILQSKIKPSKRIECVCVLLAGVGRRGGGGGDNLGLVVREGVLGKWHLGVGSSHGNNYMGLSSKDKDLKTGENPPESQQSLEVS